MNVAAGPELAAAVSNLVFPPLNVKANGIRIRSPTQGVWVLLVVLDIHQRFCVNR